MIPDPTRLEVLRIALRSHVASAADALALAEDLDLDLPELCELRDRAARAAAWAAVLAEALIHAKSGEPLH